MSHETRYLRRTTIVIASLLLIAASSSVPLGNWRMTGGGPSGLVARSRFGGPSASRGPEASSRLARARTWGVLR